MQPKPQAREYLRRLAPEAYQGNAMVHWTLTVAERRTGWLNANSHACWREVLLHTLARYSLAAPVYCLMPDHAHLLLVGLSDVSDQRQALSFLRRFSSRLFATGIKGGQWQKQAFDHVLKPDERKESAFQTIAHYIVENPKRAQLQADPESWPYSGSIVCGWPDLDWRDEDFWKRWWTIFEKSMIDQKPGSESASAT